MHVCVMQCITKSQHITYSFTTSIGRGRLFHPARHFSYIKKKKQYIFFRFNALSELFRRYTVNRIVTKPTFCICENKDADQLRGYRAKLISTFVCATWIAQYLDTKFQASSHLQWLYSLVCVRPSQSPHCCFFTLRLTVLYVSLLRY